MLLSTILSLVTRRERYIVTRAKIAATAREIKTMFHDAEPSFTKGEIPKPTPYIRPMKAMLIQRILAIMSCSATSKVTRKKIIRGAATRVATSGAAPGVTDCPIWGAIKN